MLYYCSSCFEKRKERIKNKEKDRGHFFPRDPLQGLARAGRKGDAEIASTSGQSATQLRECVCVCVCMMGGEGAIRG